MLRHCDNADSSAVWQRTPAEGPAVYFPAILSSPTMPIIPGHPTLLVPLDTKHVHKPILTHNYNITKKKKKKSTRKK